MSKRHDVTIYNAYDLLRRPDFYNSSQTEIDGRWVPSRALGPSWGQWKALWLVWTGRADVLHWPGQER